MAKRISIFQGPQDKAETAPSPINWKLCALCQEDTGEKLVDPQNSTKKSQESSGYKVLAENLLAFHQISCMPLQIRISRLDDGNGIEQTFIRNKAKWHRTCYCNCNALRLQRARKKKAEELCEQESVSPVKTRRYFSENQTTSKKVCFFCEKEEYHATVNEPLRRTQTFNVDSKVRECAKSLRDTKILAKLSDRDMAAQDAMYHLSCLSAYYYRSKSHAKKHSRCQGTSLEAYVIAELVSYIEEAQVDENITVFKLADLSKLYESRLKQLQSDNKYIVNSTRLKERLLNLIPTLRAEPHGRDILLIFEDHIGHAIHSACSSDDDSVHIMRAVQAIRQDILSKTFSFNGSFETDCETDIVPPKLLAFINMILYGTSIKDQTNTNKHKLKIALSLSELIMFNTSQRSKASTEGSVRHSRDRETPLPIYLSLMVHAKTRKRNLVDKLHSLGLGISYDRLFNISSALGNSVCAKYEEDGVVCPPKAKKDLFTVGCMDNIDHNPSSRTAQDSFHGTAISILQFPTIACLGTDRRKIIIDPDLSPTKVIPQLPMAYATVPAIALTTTKVKVPVRNGPMTPATDVSNQSLSKEQDWLKQVERLSEVACLGPTDFISWAAYHAHHQPPLGRQQTNISLLPMFHENAHSAPMVLHAMKVIKSCTEHLNPGQTPIVAMDQPLFALAKLIQWEFPEEVGEDKYVVMMGGLHLEMSLCRILGQWLSGSGWISALVKAEVTSSGRADDIEKGRNVTRARYAHEVTAAALYLLQKEAYTEYTAMVLPNETTLQFDEWCQKQSDDHPQFLFWSIALELQLKVLQFVRSIREADFALYCSTLADLASWFFIFDHTNYSRWLPVHLRDLTLIERLHPEIHQQFLHGHFAVQKTQHLFSSIALDQAHEQENEKIKGDGGAVGLTESESALQRWMIAGPEISRVVAEFEASEVKQADCRHHDQYPAVQRRFQRDVVNLRATLRDMGNPFLEDSEDLVAIDSKDVMDASTVETLKSVKTLGQQQYAAYVEERLGTDSTILLSDTIPKNKIQLFGTCPAKQHSKMKLQLANLKADNQLFSRMYISCQVREGNLSDFFKHENHAYPPSLSVVGKLRQTTKSDLIECLLHHCSAQSSTPQVTAKVFDGAVLVHMLQPKGSKNFESYAKDIFIPYIKSQLDTVSRLDVVWDIYKPSSLKHFTRENRGRGTRRKVHPMSPIPKNWQGFLRVDENKTELFAFLGQYIVALLVAGKQLYTTHADNVLSSPQQEQDPFISPCTHEEADTRLILHVAHCVKEHHTSVTIRTVDTDVVVLAVAYFQELGLEELFVAFGVGKTFRIIPCHEIAESLGHLKCKALPFFHSVTGSDTTSSFSGRGKKSAWEAWNACPAVTDTMLALSRTPATVTDQHMEEIERFVVILYSKACPLRKCDEARRELFISGSRTLDNIPPTSAALYEHIKRSVYQAGYSWGQCLVTSPQMPSPQEWGWTLENGIWSPFWTPLPEAAKSCYELVHCKCKVRCRPPCKCTMASLKCTELCTCKGGCFAN